MLIPAASFKKWDRLVCFFGGSVNATLALRCARAIGRRRKAPLTIFTRLEEARETYQHKLRAAGLAGDLEEGSADGLCFQEGDFREHLYAAPSDALGVAGAQGAAPARGASFRPRRHGRAAVRAREVPRSQEPMRPTASRVEAQ